MTNKKNAYYTVECPQYKRIVCQAGVKCSWQAGPDGYLVRTWKTQVGAEKEAGRLNQGCGLLIFQVLAHTPKA